MTGLEKIVSGILDEAQAEARSVLDQAEAEAVQIVSREKARWADACAAILQTARQRAQDIEKAGSSAIELQRRRGLLETKQQLLLETLKQAKEQLANLPEEQYFPLLVKMACASAEQGEGELLLSQRDLARLPADFAGQLAAALPQGCTLSISSQTRPIDGGFILKYGDVEQNGSFEAIFSARSEEFTDQIREILFA